jgi:hypothetical protein
VVSAYRDWFSGYGIDPRDYLRRTFEETAGYDEMVVLRDIEFESHCEHHMAPIIGRAHVGYLPTDRVVGISKLARVVDVYARRFQVQEKMTAEIARCIDEVLQAARRRRRDRGRSRVHDDARRPQARRVDDHQPDARDVPHGRTHALGIPDVHRDPRSQQVAHGNAMARKRPVGPPGTVVIHEHKSRLLARNPLGDPHVRKVAVWLPPEYERRATGGPGRRFPVLYDLVGFMGSGMSHLNWRAFSENLVERVARLRHEGRMGPVILVLPDCYTSLGGNQYVNSAAIGPYADYLIKEIIPLVDGEFRTLAKREHRACSASRRAAMAR